MIKEIRLIMPFLFKKENETVFSDEVVGHGYKGTPVFKTEEQIKFVPDYQKTNEVLIRSLHDLFMENKETLGEISEISVKPNANNYSYDIIIRSATCQWVKTIIVPCDFGKDIKLGGMR